MAALRIAASASDESTATFGGRAAIIRRFAPAGVQYFLPPTEPGVAVRNELVQHGILRIEVEDRLRVERRDRQLDADTLRADQIGQRPGRTILPSLSVGLRRLAH